jgi:hypothetical protein
MDENNSSIPETHKLGICASCPTAPVPHAEPPFSVRSDTGSQNDVNKVDGQISGATYNIVNSTRGPRVVRTEEEKHSSENRTRPSRIAEKKTAKAENQSFADADEDTSLPSGYDNWAVVAGFFDGDGGLDVEARSYTLHWVLNFTDNWPPQLIQIKRFMESQGIQVGILRRAGTGGYKMEVAGINSLQKCALAMLDGRNLFKKRKEKSLNSCLTILTGESLVTTSSAYSMRKWRLGLGSGNYEYRKFHIRTPRENESTRKGMRGIPDCYWP